jgi:general nucleoside transport system permease protein
VRAGLQVPAATETGGAGGARRAARTLSGIARAALPLVLGLVVAALLLLVVGRDPLAVYGDVVRRGLLSPSGLQDSLVRTAPLLLMASGLVVAFRAGLWNIGGDGQFLVAAALVAGAGPPLVAVLPGGPGLVLLCLLGAGAGALWALPPALLRARYGLNEIITSLMMSFVGINLANLLVKGPFRSQKTLVPQTDALPTAELLPYLPGTRVHVGLVLALFVALVVHLLLTRTSFGLRLAVLGSSPRTAAHAGLGVARLTAAAFCLSGALIGLGASVEILGVWGYLRADWNPGFGLALFALVFLARLNALAVVPLAAFYAVLSTAGSFAARRAGLPEDVLLVLVGLILLFLAAFSLQGRVRRA